VRTLHDDYGVRGFVFHEGSLEGAPDYKNTGTRRITPLAWRALTSQLEALKDTYAQDDDMEHFVFPYIYFTEAELRHGVIGDAVLTDEYITHTDKLETGQTSRLPFIACPAVDVPQTYLFGNDGERGEGAISVCNMHTIQNDAYLAEYDLGSKRFLPILDPKRNQLQALTDSPYLCPAKPGVTRDNNPSDRYHTDAGDVFHACRYISSNQFPYADRAFATEFYPSVVAYYQARWESLQTAPANLSAIDVIEAQTEDYGARLALLSAQINAAEHNV
jgi:hypothetical protein